MTSNIHVKMGEYKVCTDKKVLKSLGLGSCVAICLFDRENEIGSLGHVMLPSNRDKSSPKYANNLLDSMIESMKKEGYNRKKTVSKIFGGASLFESSIAIGDQNIESVRKELDKRNISIVAEDVGGKEGRSIWFHCWSGTVVVSKPMGRTKRF